MVRELRAPRTDIDEQGIAMLRRIVVPLDGSPFGEQALPLAVQLAERHHADLEVVHVFEALAPFMVQGAPPIDPDLDAQLRQDRQDYLDRTADRIRRASSVTVDGHALSGSEVVATLADYLAERHADLVILATHGRGGLSRLWMGSVATGLVRRSDTPVLLVRASDAPLPNVEPPALRKILLPLDGTPADEEALEDAVAVAVPSEAEFLLLNVREPVAYFEENALTPNDQAARDRTGTTVVEPYAASELEAAMKEYLEGVADRIRSRGFTATSQVVLDPSPAAAILEVADAWDIDLIVMETHARSGVSRILHGRVTDKVIRGARVPVLVHRRPVEEDGRGRAATAEGAERPWS